MTEHSLVLLEALYLRRHLVAYYGGKTYTLQPFSMYGKRYRITERTYGVPNYRQWSFANVQDAIAQALILVPFEQWEVDDD